MATRSVLWHVLRSNSKLWQISASPAYGDTGESLSINEHTYSASSLLDEGYKGIWLNTVGDTSDVEAI